ncbi:MAG: hypothetical protein KAS36_16450 [Anaerolineales bacterium]|nr:hypothetical protein [Anaerolineales bacterium]
MEKKTVFESPYEQYAHKNGQPFEILGEVPRETIDFAEVGSLFHIKFADSERIEAWPEEIYEEQLLRS